MTDIPQHLRGLVSGATPNGAWVCIHGRSLGVCASCAPAAEAALAKQSAPCPTCQLPDGSPNSVYLQGNATCVFGCGNVIDMDHGFCAHCKDHSANEHECEACGKIWADWRLKWEVMT